MQMNRVRGLLLVSAAAVLSLALLTGPAAAEPASPGQAPIVSVVATGLSAPKYLHFGPGGLYVAEAGTGGSQCLPATGVTGAPTQFCVGRTGSIARIDRSGVTTVVSGLESTIEQDVGETTGPTSVTFVGHRPAVLFQDSPDNPDGTSVIPGPLGRERGTLRLASLGQPAGRLPVLANLRRFAAAHPQDPATVGGFPGEAAYDSDAHDIVPYRGGYAIADAGANDVLWLSHWGRLSVIARLPTVPEAAPAGALGPGSPAQTIDAQAVPASLAVGPDGGLYVGELRGQPSLPGTADIYRLAPGHAPIAVVTGLTRVSDLAFDRQGRLLVLERNTGGGESSTPGALLRVNLDQDGDRAAQIATLSVSGLLAPVGLAVGRDGAVYITNHGTSAGTASPSADVLKVSHLG